MTDDLLAPRNALPMLDEDIRRLYLEATAPPPEVAKQELYENTSVKIVDVGINVFLAIAIGVNVSENGFLIFAIVAILNILLFISKIKVMGIASLLRFFETRFAEFGKKSDFRKNAQFPLTNEVLNKVVEYVSKGPLERHEQISRKIELNRTQITKSMANLAQIVSSLQTELTGNVEPEISLLVSSRLDSAIACQNKLDELSEEFRIQLEQAEAAIKPVASLRDKFSFLSKVSSDLSAIQRAHGLIEEAQVQVIENRTQIQLLQTASRVAVSQLSEIESIVESKELARAEVAQLSL